MEMNELTWDEIAMVSGGADQKKCVKREHDVVPCAQSNRGDVANDISNGAYVVGSAVVEFISSLFD
ncbi:hypothetical protein LP420_28330 [Massilia sp. B-10]|nr:hypothetical protein LP420_28330 [Massilia sp. B-10]UUZ52928.1 hypothetical protein LP419_27900 [Massilia sp. H-1]